MTAKRLSKRAIDARRAWGIALSVVGAVCLVAAAVLFSYNRYDDSRAGVESDAVMAELYAGIQDPAHRADGSPGEAIGDASYVGYIKLPSLDLTLPVASELTTENLATSPCVYAGSAVRNDLVIAAHNYRVHFGPIGRLQPGDAVEFIDYHGISYTYVVSATEILGPYDVGSMIDSEYDLTLFTCTLDGSQRVTVRCMRD